MEAMRRLKRRISDAIYRQLVIDAQRAVGTEPGGHHGATLQSSAAELPHPVIDTSDQPLPGPAPATLLTPNRVRNSPAVFRVLSSPGLEDVTVRDVVVFDPLDSPVVQQGDLLLCVGLLASSPEAGEIVEAAAGAGAAAVVVKSRDAELRLLRETAERVRMTVMVLPTAMRWEQIAVLVRTAISSAGSRPGSLTAVGGLVRVRERVGPCCKGSSHH
jgi:hypothetical protein